MSSFVKMEAGEKVERVEKGKEGSEPEGFQPQHQSSGGGQEKEKWEETQVNLFLNFDFESEGEVDNEALRKRLVSKSEELTSLLPKIKRAAVFQLRRGADGCYKIPGEVFYMVEEARYELGRQVREMARMYNTEVKRYVLDWEMANERKLRGVKEPPAELVLDELGVGEKNMEELWKAKQRVCAGRTKISSPSSFELSGESLLSPIPSRSEGSAGLPTGSGGYLKLEHRIQMKDIPKLKGKEGAKGSIKEWAKFQDNFPSKMRAGGRNDKEAIAHLLQVIHNDLVRELEEDDRGVRSESLKSCMELLKECFVGRDWKEKAKHFAKQFRQNWSWEIREFRREFTLVCEVAEWEKEVMVGVCSSFKARYKLEEWLSEGERKFLEEKGVILTDSSWVDIWERLEEIHEDQTMRMVLKEESREKKEASKGKETFKPRTDYSQGGRGIGNRGRGNGRGLDKLSGCRETAYEGKTNDVGAKKQKEQKEQRGTAEKTRGTKMQKEKQKK